MTKSFIDIQHVKINVKDVFAIDFLFNKGGKNYLLSIGTHTKPFSIGNVKRANGNIYRGYSGDCKTLSKHKEELFHYFITLPSISWKWDIYQSPRINTLQMTDVHQEKRGNGGIDIYFTLHDCSFYLFISEKDLCYSPAYVLQMGGDRWTGQFFSQLLTLYKEELFRHLIEFPSIRLKWLYIPHN